MTKPHIEPAWTMDRPFAPQMGQTYELAFVVPGDEDASRPVTRKLRIDGTLPSEWFDVEAHRMLEPQLQALHVAGYRLVDA